MQLRIEAVFEFRLYCRYQVCAFCYGRLNLESKKQCPGCRQEYGTSPVTLPEGGELINRGTTATTPVAKDPAKHNGSGTETLRNFCLISFYYFQLQSCLLVAKQ